MCNRIFIVPSSFNAQTDVPAFSFPNQKEMETILDRIMPMGFKSMDDAWRSHFIKLLNID